jgi:hypothetical protein
MLNVAIMHNLKLNEFLKALYCSFQEKLDSLQKELEGIPMRVPLSNSPVHHVTLHQAGL